MLVPLFGVGLPVVAGALGATRALADVHRGVAGQVLGADLAVRYRAEPGPTWRELAACLRDPQTGRDMIWLALHAVAGTLVALFAARREVPGLPVLVLSQYVEQLYARELLADHAGGVGYLLKDRVGNVDEFVAAVRRVAAGGTAMDPEVVGQLVGRRTTPLAALTPREREVLELVAQGRSNAAIAAALTVTEKAVGKHISSIFGKLALAPSDDDNRRVRAVLAYLQAVS